MKNYEYTVEVRNKEKKYGFVNMCWHVFKTYEEAKKYADEWQERLYGDKPAMEKEYNEKYGDGKCAIIMYKRPVGEWEECERFDPAK